MQFICLEFCRFSVLCSLDYYYIISVFSYKVVFVYFCLMIIFLYWVLRWVTVWFPMWIWVLKQKPADSHWFKTHFVGHVKDQREIPLGSLKWLCCLPAKRRRDAARKWAGDGLFTDPSYFPSHMRRTLQNAGVPGPRAPYPGQRASSSSPSGAQEGLWAIDPIKN